MAWIRDCLSERKTCVSSLQLLPSTSIGRAVGSPSGAASTGSKCHTPQLNRDSLLSLAQRLVLDHVNRTIVNNQVSKLPCKQTLENELGWGVEQCVFQRIRLRTVFASYKQAHGENQARNPDTLPHYFLTE